MKCPVRRDKPAGDETLAEAPQAEPLPVAAWLMPEPARPAEAAGQLPLFGGLVLDTPVAAGGGEGVAVEIKRRRRKSKAHN